MKNVTLFIPLCALVSFGILNSMKRSADSLEPMLTLQANTYYTPLVSAVTTIENDLLRALLWTIPVDPIEMTHEKNYIESLWQQPTSALMNIVTISAAKEVSRRCTCTFEGCNKSFTNNSNLKIHVQTHTGEKLYACTFCTKKFSYHCKLIIHMRTHTGEKPYLCTFEGCNKSFAQNNGLAGHIRTHTGERPYVCTFEGCNKPFRRQDTLTIHMRRHTGEKPYLCILCNTSFARNSSLIVHMRTHTGEKPYMCILCNESFTKNASLKKHTRTQHADKN